jgi:hypothetical protein
MIDLLLWGMLLSYQQIVNSGAAWTLVSAHYLLQLLQAHVAWPVAQDPWRRILQ